MLSPLYRGRVTTKGGCEAIRLKAVLDYATFDHTAASLELVATLSAAGGGAKKPVETLTIAGDGQIQPIVNLTFKTPPLSLQVGQFIVNCSLRNSSSGEILSSTNHSLTRVADDAPEPTVWLDGHQRLIRHGRPTFPLGLYLSTVSSEDLATISQSKFNTIMPYRAPANTSVMDEIHQHGLFVLFSTKDSYFGGPNAYKTIITSRAAEEGFVKSQVSK